MPLQWTSETSGPLLLAAMFFFYLYFTPTLIAFLRGHGRFRPILILNLLAAPLQIAVAYFFLPPPNLQSAPTTLLGLAFLEYLGLIWIIALTWALRPISVPDPTLLAARNTKTFDFIAALPLIAWFANSAIQLRPVLSLDMTLMLTGTATLFIWLQFFSLLFSALFCLLTVYMLVVRDKPVLRARGWLPRFCAVAGTFLGVGILRLPVADLGLSAQLAACILIGCGSLSSILIVARLGKSFSILPEARRLVTVGPYAYARHPLYAAEMFTIAGTVIQYQQPWAGLLGVAVIGLQVTRSVFEERVLIEAFPDYADYRAKTKRFIPGLI